MKSGIILSASLSVCLSVFRTLESCINASRYTLQQAKFRDPDLRDSLYSNQCDKDSENWINNAQYLGNGARYEISFYYSHTLGSHIWVSHCYQNRWPRMTLNSVMADILRYFTEFGTFRWQPIRYSR